MSDKEDFDENEAGDNISDFGAEEEDEDEEEMGESESDEEEVVYDEEIDHAKITHGESGQKYLDSLIKVDTALFERVDSLVNKSDLQRIELKTLLGFRYMVQYIFGIGVAKTVFNCENTIVNIKNRHKDTTDHFETADEIVALVFDFMDNKLSSAYTLKLSSTTKYIYSQSLLISKIVILENLASKLVLGTITKTVLADIFESIYLDVLRGILDPGEMIGSQNATSLSEVLSQMTLNTFHLAGNSNSKINLGMGRLTQILNYTKTDKILKDLYVDIRLYPHEDTDQNRIKKIASRFNSTKFKTLVKLMQIVQDPELYDGKSRIAEDESAIRKHIKTHGNLPGIRRILSLRLVFNDDELFNTRIDIFEIVKTIRDTFPNVAIIVTGVNSLRIVNTVTSGDEYLIYKDLINKLKTFHILGIPGISGVDVLEDNVEYRDANGNLKTRKKFKLFAQGVNLRKIIGNKYIDGYRSFTNDIQETYDTLGINATIVVLIREIRNVYRANGANPSESSIRMLVNAMTRDGFVTPINNIGLKQSNAAIMQQLSFEKAEQVIVESAVYGVNETVNGTSNNVILGQPFNGGTNAFKLII